MIAAIVLYIGDSLSDAKRSELTICPVAFMKLRYINRFYCIKNGYSNLNTDLNPEINGKTLSIDEVTKYILKNNLSISEENIL